MRKFRNLLRVSLPESVVQKLSTAYRVFKVVTFFYILAAGMWIMLTRSLMVGITFIFLKFGTFWLTSIFAPAAVTKGV